MQLSTAYETERLTPAEPCLLSYRFLLRFLCPTRFHGNVFLMTKIKVVSVTVKTWNLPSLPPVKVEREREKRKRNPCPQRKRKKMFFRWWWHRTHARGERWRHSYVRSAPHSLVLSVRTTGVRSAHFHLLQGKRENNFTRSLWKSKGCTAQRGEEKSEIRPRQGEKRNRERSTLLSTKRIKEKTEEEKERESDDALERGRNLLARGRRDFTWGGFELFFRGEGFTPVIGSTVHMLFSLYFRHLCERLNFEIFFLKSTSNRQWGNT